MRQFLAIALPEASRDALARLQRRLAGEAAGWKWVHPASIHLTLRFLGVVDPLRDAAARPRWRDAAQAGPPLCFRLEGVGHFPRSGRPRIAWVGIADERPHGGLAALAGRLECAARELGFAPEARGFHAHLTLARARSRVGASAVGGPDFSGPQVRATQLVLYRSELRPDGARYTEVDRYPLAGAAPG